MKILYKVRTIAIAIIAAVVLANCSSFCAQAVEEKTPAYRLGIIPTQNNMGLLEPGKTYDGEFKVKNTGRNKTEYRIDISPYSVEGEDYQPVYDKPSSYTEISDWIKVSKKSGKLEPGSEDIIQYTVSIPNEAQGGAQSAVVVIEMINPNSGENSTAVEIVQQLGYIIYGNVDGDIIETANIVENKIPSFLFKAPIYAESVVENTGNVYSNAEYTLQVFPLFSDEEVYTTEEDPSKEVIFPETKRYNKVTWEGSPQLGIYRVRQTVKLFDQTSTEEKLVFICPLWFLFICVAVLFIILFSIIHRLRHRE